MYTINVSYVLISVKVYLISDSSLSSKPHDKLTTKVTMATIVSASFKVTSLLIIYVESPLAHINPILANTAKIPEALPCEDDST
jgi:hypothetical protein